MRVESDFRDGRLELSFELDRNDREHLENSDSKMNEGLEVYVDLGSEVKELHPDQVALATILICNPFVGKELHLPGPVSEAFYNSVSSVISRYRIQKNCVEDIVPMSAKNRSLPSLAFSGGADSTAALSVMPGETIPVFLNRPETRGSRYDPDAALEICRGIGESGYDVQIVDSNLEFIRDPVGFPTDLAHAVPVVLLADSLDIGSVSFGTIMESGYGIGHEKFHDYRFTAHKKFFGRMFDSIGIELAMPVIGVSEVGTAMICGKSPFGHYSQSCIRGTWLRPCMSCWKCFRKELLAVSLGLSDSQDLVSMMETNEVQIRLSSFPISHENVIIYAIQRMDLEEHPYLKPVASKLDMSARLDFLETWYPCSIDLVPHKMRHSVRSKILQFLDVMSPDQESDFMKWDMHDHLESDRAKKAQERLTSVWQDFSSRFGK